LTVIAVIADDFTGAAELAGIGLRYGLTVELNTSVPNATSLDLLIVPTNTRSASADDAYEAVYSISKDLYRIGAQWLYKKTDSVLRGNVVTELNALLKASGKNKVLFIPANPSLDRTITNGIYFIQGKPLHESEFAKTMLTFRSSSNVIDLLGVSPFVTVRAIKANEEIVDNCLSVGEASDLGDLRTWAAKVNREVITAGAGDFFEALLQAEGFKTSSDYKSQTFQLGEKVLIVCASPFHKSREFVAEARRRGIPICEMPEGLFKNNQPRKPDVDEWADQATSAFQIAPKVILTINKPFVRNKAFARQLRELTAMTVEKIMKVVTLNELLVEGGDTVSSIYQRLKFGRFYPTNELARGVLRMKVDDRPLYFTIKPGSYAWPESIW
jgi:uncharacterized protein YgbK (DUF1537 family)